jgi:hypothetical protein
MAGFTSPPIVLFTRDIERAARRPSTRRAGFQKAFRTPHGGHPDPRREGRPAACFAFIRNAAAGTPYVANPSMTTTTELRVMTAYSSTPVRRAARSEPMKAFARAGLAARACVYLLVGVLAIALAVGARKGETDQRGALQELTKHTGGTILVWLIAIGLFGYALWRFSEAAFGVVGEGKKAGPRVQSFARGLIYLFFAVSAVKVAADAGAGSQAGQQELWTAKALQHTGGRWIVGIVGAVIVVCGAVLVWEGVKRKFEKYFDMGQMSYNQRRTVRVLGVIGSVARGIVFAVAGVFVIVAAVKSNPHKAGGLDQALRELLNLTGGPVIVFVAGLGLIAFGVYGFAEAKWRRT